MNLINIISSQLTTQYLNWEMNSKIIFRMKIGIMKIALKRYMRINILYDSRLILGSSRSSNSILSGSSTGILWAGGRFDCIFNSLLFSVVFGEVFMIKILFDYDMNMNFKKREIIEWPKGIVWFLGTPILNFFHFCTFCSRNSHHTADCECNIHSTSSGNDSWRTNSPQFFAFRTSIATGIYIF